MEATDPVLRVRDLNVRFPRADREVHAVSGVAMTVQAGEVLGILGESGCGKSTLALALTRLVAGAGRVEARELRIDGIDVLALRQRQLQHLRGRVVGTVFQDPTTSLNPLRSIGDQVGESLARHMGLRGARARRRCVELLDQVGIPNAGRRADEYPHQLSGGLRQRAAIAMAISGNPRLLIADEPTTALDVTVQKQILNLLVRLKEEQNLAVVLVTHDIAVMDTVADRVRVMYAGYVVESGPTQATLDEPAHPYTSALMGSALPLDGPRRRRLTTIPGMPPMLLSAADSCPFMPRCPVAIEVCHDRNPDPIDISAAHSVACHLAGAPDRPVIGPPLAPGSAYARTRDPRPELRLGLDEPTGGAPILRVNELRVHFRHRRFGGRAGSQANRAVDGVSFEIAAGETLGLVGQSGCGKTTTGRAALRLIEPTGGSIQYDGIELTDLTNRGMRKYRRHMQMIFQDPSSSLDPRLSVGKAITEPLLVHGLVDNRASAADRGHELLEAVALKPEVYDRLPHELSGGQRQRVAIARALGLEPRLLVCDEVTASLDVSVQAQVVNLLQELQDRLGLAYLFISHNLSVVRHLSHRVAVMFMGEIVELGPIDDVLNMPAHPYTRDLLAATPTMNHRHEPGEAVQLPSQARTVSRPEALAGCPYFGSCAFAVARCAAEAPALISTGDDRRLAACHYSADVLAAGQRPADGMNSTSAKRSAS